MLFIEDGVYHCMESSGIFDTKTSIKFCALAEDVDARGLKNKLNISVSTIDTAGFVELCVRFDKIVNWF